VISPELVAVSKRVFRDDALKSMVPKSSWAGENTGLSVRPGACRMGICGTACVGAGVGEGCGETAGLAVAFPEAEAWAPASRLHASKMIVNQQSVFISILLFPGRFPPADEV